MAKKKTGPPYTSRSAEYVLITYPWGMSPDSKRRDSRDFDRLGAWIQYMLHEKGIHAQVECIYTMGTRSEVVIQLPYGTDIQSLLGEHKWSLIAKKWDGNPDDPRASCIFEYNFRNNGDPGNHNWTDQYPNPLPEGVIVPAKSPYPEPNWAEPPSSIRSLVFPIPFRSPPHIPEPEPTPTSVPVKMTPLLPSIPTSSSLQLTPISPPPPVDITSAFRPYEPPMQHPAHGTFINQTNQPKSTCADHSSPPAKGNNLPGLKYMKKLDPYQEEEEAEALLRTPPQDHCGDSKPIKQEAMKRELTDTEHELKYQPSSELMDAIDSLIQEQNKEKKAAVFEGSSLTATPRLGSSAASYQPSAELVDAIDSLVREQDLDSKPLTEEGYQPTQDPRQKTHYQPSAELTNAINSLLQQSTVNEEDQKQVLDPRPQKKRRVVQGEHPGV